MELQSRVTHAAPQSRRGWMRLRVFVPLLFAFSIGLAFVRPHVVQDGSYLSDFLLPWQAAQHPASLPLPQSGAARADIFCACPAALNATCFCPTLQPYTAIAYPTAWFFVAYELAAFLTLYSAARGMMRVYRRIQNVGGRIAFDFVILLTIAILGLALLGLGILLRDVIPHDVNTPSWFDA